MRSWLRRWRRAPCETAAAASSVADVAAHAGGPLPARHSLCAADDEIPRYPPFLKGLPLPPIARLVGTQSELIGRLRRELALGDEDDGTDRWQAYVGSVIERYAAFVHLIPASETHHHRGAGGLYRHGLEAAVHAARASRGVLVALNRPRAEQRRLEPRLRAAAALGGLLHDAGKAIHDVAATDETGRTTWSPIEADLDAWAARHGLRRYFLRWRAERAHGGHEVFNVLALQRILPARVERWLSDPDPGLYSGLVAAVTGVPHSSVLVELVREADRQSVERDLREHRIEPIDTAVGVPVDRYLLDAMRRLLHDGRWRVNVPGARVWLLRDAGLHLVWPAAARDLTELLAADRVPGIPRDADTIAELLLERGLAVPRVDALGRHPTWRLAPLALARGPDRPVVLTLLRLQSPALLFPFGAPEAAALAEHPTAHRCDPVADAAVASDGGGPAESDSNADCRALAADKPSAAPEPGRDGIVCDPDDGHGSEAPRPAPEEARRWLSGAATGAARLLACIDVLRSEIGGSAHWRQGCLWLRYPDWFERAGWCAAEAAHALSGAGLLETDPRTPMRRVRDHAGRRWLVLNAQVSGHLRTLLDGAAHDTGAALPADQGRGSEPTPTLIEAVLRAVIAQDGPADGTRRHVLEHATLKALARRHQLGVYRLRERLLSDPRITEDAHKRLVLTL
jgi:conjugal transfer pilus assembly protein TraI